jgi:hypothetical protein
MWKRGALAFGTVAEVALMVAPPIKGVVSLTERAIFQVGKSAMGRAVERQMLKTTEKTIAVATERKIVQRTATKIEEQFLLKEGTTVASNPLKGTSYTPKVIKDMQLNAKTAKPDFHGFPRIVDNYAGYGRVESITGRDGITRTKVTLPGGYQNKEGHFEWIIETDNTINHRLFIPNP